MPVQTVLALLLLVSSVTFASAVETRNRQSYPLKELAGYLDGFDEPPLPSLVTDDASVFRFTSIACTNPATVIRIETFKDRRPARITIKTQRWISTSDGNGAPGRVRTKTRDLQPKKLEEFRSLFASHDLCREPVTTDIVYDAPDWTFEFANATRHCATLKRPLVDESYESLVRFLMEFRPRGGGPACG